MTKNFPTNIRRICDEKFFFVQDFLKLIIFAKAKQQSKNLTKMEFRKKKYKLFVMLALK